MRALRAIFRLNPPSGHADEPSVTSREGSMRRDHDKGEKASSGARRNLDRHVSDADAAARRDSCVIAVALALAIALVTRYEVTTHLREVVEVLDVWQLDDLLLIAALAAVAIVVFSMRQSARLAREVALRQEVQDALTHQASHDPLTGVANRRLLFEKAEAATESMRRQPDSLTVVYIDLDVFKSVNDRYGHEAGDELLREAARRLAATTRSADTVARVGGDEFVILAETTGVDAARGLARRVFEQLSIPYQIDDELVAAGASIGVATTKDPDVSADRLIALADAAMYRAKQSGRGRVELDVVGEDGAVL